MRLADIKNPTDEQIREDMLRRISQSLQQELSSICSIIKTNRAYSAKINQTRIVAYEQRRNNLNRIIDELDAGNITISIFGGTK